MNLRPRRPDPLRIDLTPLIDVVFLMLIFFMVSTTFDKQTQLKVDLPSAASGERQERSHDKIAVTIDAKGHFYVNDRELVSHDAATLQRAFEKIAGGRTDIPVIVTGDRKAPIQAMVTVMDVAARLGMSRLSVTAGRGPRAEGNP